MEQAFWHQRWQDNQIGFHLPEPHALLSKYLQKLPQSKNTTVLVPLCGKTLDIGFLLQQGYTVVGVELSEIAVNQLFEALLLVPTITACGELKRFQAGQLTVYAGDIFELKAEDLGQVDWVYDRAALVALPSAMREQYAQQLMALTNDAPQFLITIEYDQALLEGPPFAIDQTMVQQYYQQHYQLQHVAQAVIAGGLKGKVDASEHLWLLTRSA